MMELTPKGAKARIGLAVSILLHLAFLTAAVLSLPHWRTPPESRGVEVSLVSLRPPRVPPRTRTARPAPVMPSALPPVAAPAPPAQPPSPIAPTAPASPGAGADPDARAKVTALLRGSFGCSEAQLVHLSQEEQDRCAKWRQTQAKPGLEILAPIEANKRAWFDATVAARNAPDHGPSGSCFGKPAHGVKLGPLPCYIELPKGPFSEDVDVPPEPEHSR